MTVEQRHYYHFPNGTQYRHSNKYIDQIKQVNYIDLVPCTLQNFFTFIGKVQLGLQRLIQLHLQNFLRPNLNFIQSLNLTVGGVWASTDYNFQSFCHQLQGFSNFTWKPTCKTLDEIQATLDWEGNFRFKLILQMLYLQSIFKQFLNPNRPENYVQPYLIFFFCSKQNDGQYNIFFRKKRVTTDQEIIIYSIQKNETFTFQNYGDQREQFEITKITIYYYGAFYFQRNPYSYRINIKFLRLDELLNDLGGFRQFMIVVVVQDQDSKLLTSNNIYCQGLI